MRLSLAKSDGGGLSFEPRIDASQAAPAKGRGEPGRRSRAHEGVVYGCCVPALTRFTSRHCPGPPRLAPTLDRIPRTSARDGRAYHIRRPGQETKSPQTHHYFIDHLCVIDTFVSIGDSLWEREIRYRSRLPSVRASPIEPSFGRSHEISSRPSSLPRRSSCFSAARNYYDGRRTSVPSSDPSRFGTD